MRNEEVSSGGVVGASLGENVGTGVASTGVGKKTDARQSRTSGTQSRTNRESTLRAHVCSVEHFEQRGNSQYKRHV